MSCFHPKIMIFNGVDERGKRHCGYFGDWNNFCQDNLLKFGTNPDIFQVPCGKCLGCKLDRARDWRNRLICESVYHDHIWFLTLTYDPAHVPMNEDGSMTLCKRDLQLFLKRLRKRFEPEQIRFFAAGEYGTQTLRPHYHLIIFGGAIPDLVPVSSNFRGEQYYQSDIINSLWPAGHTVLAPATPDTMGYVSRYCMKKMFNDKSVYDDLHVEPEFIQMSRKPGLGHQFLIDNYDKFFELKYVNVSTEKGGVKIYRNKYFTNLLDLIDHDAVTAIKSAASDRAYEKAVSLMEKSDLSYEEYLSAQEYSFDKKTKILQRRDNFGET